MNNHPTVNDGPRSAALAARPLLRTPGPRPLVPRPSFRRGFTLIELMVVMAIMATLAAVMAYAVAGAQEMAQIAKTRALIARLNTLVMQKYESYRTRRLPIVIPGEVIDPTTNKLIPTPAGVKGKVRIDAIRQLMRMEMPERWTDIIDPPKAIALEAPPGTFYTDPTVPPTNPPTQAINMYRTASSQAYLTFFNSINVARNTAFQQDPLGYQGAKCLYLLVTLGLDEPDVMENFSEGDIADFDHTGCKVFLDAWGHPIQFLRWAPGLYSPLQPTPPPIVPRGSAVPKDMRMPDQTDPTGFYGSPKPGSLDPTTASVPAVTGLISGNTFALYPLIFSAGPDGNYDTVTEITNTSSPQAEMVAGQASLSYSKTNPSNDPFESVSHPADFVDGPIGWPAIYPTTDRLGRSPGTSDNITNHSIGAR